MGRPLAGARGIGGTPAGVGGLPDFRGKAAAGRAGGWDGIAEAIVRGGKVRIEYAGGTRGSSPREVSPRKFDQKGGVAYLVAFCHIDALEKSFRLDRVRWYEVIP